MSRLAFICLLSCVASCGQKMDTLSQRLPCTSDIDCPPSDSCLLDRCVPDGSIPADETCTSEDQCDSGLTCYGFVCVPGCSDVYHQDDCAEGLWCKPTDHTFVRDQEGRRSMLGVCVESECTPPDASTCAETEVCAHVGAGLGACVNGCSYGFVSEGYRDTCENQDGLAHSCHPLGLNQTPACLPSGDPTGLQAGQAGCDSIQYPCAPENVCVQVVCRQLCHIGQTNPCGPAESCIPLADREDVSYCKAE